MRSRETHAALLSLVAVLCVCACAHAAQGRAGQLSITIDPGAVSDAVQKALQDANDAIAQRQAEYLKAKAIADASANEAAKKAATKAQQEADKAAEAAKVAAEALTSHEKDLEAWRDRFTKDRRALREQTRALQDRVREEVRAQRPTMSQEALDQLKAEAVSEAVKQAKAALGLDERLAKSLKAQKAAEAAAASKALAAGVQSGATKSDAANSGNAGKAVSAQVAEADANTAAALKQLQNKVLEEEKQKSAAKDAAKKKADEDRKALEKAQTERQQLQQQMQQLLSTMDAKRREQMQANIQAAAEVENKANQRRIESEQLEKKLLQQQAEAVKEAKEKDEKIREQAEKARQRIAEQQEKDLAAQKKAEADNKATERIEAANKEKLREEASKEAAVKAEKRKEAAAKQEEADRLAAEKRKEAADKKVEEEKVKAIELEKQRKEEASKEAQRKKEEAEQKAEERTKEEAKQKAEQKAKDEAAAEQKKKEELAAAQRQEATDKAKERAEQDTKREAEQKAEATAKAKEQVTKEQEKKQEETEKAKLKAESEVRTEQDTKSESKVKEAIREEAEKITVQHNKREDTLKQQANNAAEADKKAKEKLELEQQAEASQKVAQQQEAKAKQQQEQAKKEEEAKAKAAEATSKKEQEVKAQQKKAEEDTKAAAKAEQDAKAKQQAQEAEAKRAAEQQAKEKAEQQGKEADAKRAEAQKVAAAKEAAKKEVLRKKALEEKEKRESQLTFEAAVEPYGHEYAAPQFVVKGPICFLTGLAHYKDYKPGMKLATLPAKCRPTGRLIFDQHVSRLATARTDITKDGDILLVATSLEVTGGFFSLDKMFFIVHNLDTIQDVRLGNNWMNYGDEYMDVVWAREGDFCVVQGLARLRGGWSNPVGTLPRDCRPLDGRLIFNLNHHVISARVDVLREGEIHYVTNVGSYNWLSLTGIGFYVESATNQLDMAPGWGQYGNGYRRPSWQLDSSRVCAVSGLATYAGQGHVATLPAECRPKNRLVFSTNLHQHSERVDVFPDGKIMWIAGTEAHGWLSLDGIVFVTDVPATRPPESISHKLEVRALNLSSDWSNYGGAYRKASMAVWDQVCLLSGFVRTRNVRTAIASLTDPCLPAANGTRAVWNRHAANAETARVDIGGPGLEIKWVAGSRNGNWLSLDGIILPVRGARLSPLHLQPPYVAYGSQYDEPSYFLRKGLCTIQGLVRDKEFRTLPGGVLGYVPDECKPEFALIFLVNHQEHSNVVYLYNDGRLQWTDGPRSQPWVSLSGISYPVAVSNNMISMLSGWGPYQNGFRFPVWRRFGPICVLSGLAGGNGGPWVANLPSNCRPAQRAVFHTSHYWWAARLDVLPDGRVLYVEGGRNWGWVSFDGIRFLVDSKPEPAGVKLAVEQSKSVRVTLSEDVTAVGRGYAPPLFTRVGGVCIGSGVSQQSNMRRVLATLDESCRPVGVAMFRVGLAEGTMARFDVSPDGTLRWRSGSSAGRWLTYSSFFFPVNASALNPITLYYMWMPYQGAKENEPSFVVQGSLCLLTGRLEVDSFNTHMAGHFARLPGQCRPADGRLIFTMLNGENYLRADITQNGDIYHVANSWMNSFFSLDGIGFFVHTTTSPLSLLSGWGPYSSAATSGIAHGQYRAPSFRKEGNLCGLSGLAGGNGGEHLATLPRECWPEGSMIFHANQHDRFNLIVVNGTNGEVRYEPRNDLITAGGPRGHGWVSLDGIFWAVPTFEEESDPAAVQEAHECKEGKPIALQNDWRPYAYEGEVFRPPVYTKVGQVVLLSGVAAGPDMKRTLGALPPEVRPARRHVFDMHGEYTHQFRVDVLPTGEITWVMGSIDGNWISLDSMIYAVNGTEFTPFQLLGRYVNYFEGYAEASYYVQDELCLVQGMIRDRYNAHMQGHVGILPTDCRPREGQLIFRQPSINYAHRIDVATNGYLYYQWGVSYQNDFRSLDGIAFFVRSQQPLQLLNGYGVYGHGYRPPSYRRQDNICMLSGLASGSSWGAVTVVPEECRPAERLIFSLPNHNYNPRFDLLPDGRLISVYGGVNHNWVSLDTVRYVVPAQQSRPQLAAVRDTEAKAADLPLANGLQAYKRGYLEPQFYRFGGMCMLSGLARTTNIRQHWAELPEACRPERRHVFDEHVEGTHTARIDVLPTGAVKFVAGIGNSVWASFDGIVFPVRGTPRAPIQLHNSWTNYGLGYESAGYTKQGDVCFVHGFIKPYGIHSTTWFTHIATLPEECWPKDGQLIFNLNYNEQTHRVDVTARGEVHWVTGAGDTRRYNLLSLGGMGVVAVRGLNLPFASGNWYNYNSGYRAPMFFVQGSVCYLSGLTANNGNSREVARLPDTCRPASRLVFHINHHYLVHRFDVLPTGLVEWVDGSRNWNWASLEGIRFVTASQSDSK